MDEREKMYQAYLLRLWPVDQNGGRNWRASLQCVSSGERQGFESLEALFAYIRAMTAENGRPRQRPEKDETNEKTRKD